MTVYSGFDPGTFQGWALNLFNNVFVKAGIARGFQITQTTTPMLAVQNTLDSVAQDAVLFLPNGAFVRLDAVTRFSVNGNSSGSTRTDALVAQVDPTNQNNFFLSVQANWSTGFTPANNNQFVICLISVANNASSITNADITMNSAQAQVTGVGGATSLQASDGVTMVAQDNSASSTFSLALSNLTTGVGRAVAIQAVDTSSLGHIYTFGTDGYFVAPAGLRGQQWFLDPTAINGETPNSVYVTAQSGGVNTHLDVHIHNPTGGQIYLDTEYGSARIDSDGILRTTAAIATNASSSYTVNGHVYTVSYTQPANPAKFDVWVRSLTNF